MCIYSVLYRLYRFIQKLIKFPAQLCFLYTLLFAYQKRKKKSHHQPIVGGGGGGGGVCGVGEWGGRDLTVKEASKFDYVRNLDHWFS